MVKKERNITQIYLCPKCKKEVSFKNVSKGYTACCENCDEDFYNFELELLDIYPENR